MPGTDSLGAVHWVKRNLSKVTAEQGQLCLYIWFGTCDLTTKRGKFIFLKNLEHALNGLKNS